MKKIIYLACLVITTNLLSISLSDAEKDYIKLHPTVKVHNELNWAPFNFNENGEPKGLSIDYMRLVAAKTGLKVEFVHGPSWNEFLEMIKDGRIDVMLNIVRNEEREKFLLFTSHYQEAPHGIIVGKNSDKKITNLEELVKSRIAIEEGLFNHNYLTKNHPNTQLVLRKDTLGALQAVSYGEADATFGILPIENHIIQKNGLNNLKIIGVSDDKLFAPKKLCMATSINNPILAGILQKGINEVTEEEKTQIHKKWVNIELTSRIDYELLAKIIGVFTLIVGSTLYWVLRLKRLQHKLESSHLLLKTMIDALPNPVFYKDENARFVGFNKAYQETFGIKEDEFIGKSVLEIERWPLKDREFYQVEDLQTIATSSQVTREQDIVLQNGKSLRTIYSASGFKDAKGDPAGLIGVFVDITKQKEAEAVIQHAMGELVELHKNVSSSIEYASMIQSALISNSKILVPYFSQSFAVWQPKDTVGGDIYMFEEIIQNESCLMFIIDCTGHGVPGAFVTMLVGAIERSVVADIRANPTNEISPAKILGFFNKSVKQILKQEDKDAMSNAGFDGTVVYYDKKTSMLKFASAQNVVMLFRDGALQEFKGDRHSVGYRNSDAEFCFKENEIIVEKGDRFFFSTDGLYDQNGGAKDLPLGRKKVAKIFLENQNEALADIKELILQELSDYQGARERNDDISFVCVEI